MSRSNYLRSKKFKLECHLLSETRIYYNPYAAVYDRNSVILGESLNCFTLAVKDVRKMIECFIVEGFKGIRKTFKKRKDFLFGRMNKIKYPTIFDLFNNKILIKKLVDKVCSIIYSFVTRHNFYKYFVEKRREIVEKAGNNWRNEEEFLQSCTFVVNTILTYGSRCWEGFIYRETITRSFFREFSYLIREKV